MSSSALAPMWASPKSEMLNCFSGPAISIITLMNVHVVELPGWRHFVFLAEAECGGGTAADEEDPGQAPAEMCKFLSSKSSQMHKRVSLMLINYKWGYFFLLKGLSDELDSSSNIPLSSFLLFSFFWYFYSVIK